ncbi:MAG: heavy metal-associated domain-containing protein [Myxococcota bacterium]
MERETMLDVEGMTCGSCMGRVNRALKAVTGVRQVDVRMREGRVLVRHDVESAPVEQLVEALRDAGYESAPAATPS